MEHGLEVHIAIIGNLGGSALITLSCSDDDDTVGTTGTVDSSGGSIFQDVHRLDIGGVDIRKLSHEGDSVEHDQRVVGSTQRALTTDTDLHFLTRLGRGLCHEHTSNTTLEGLCGIGSCNLVQFLTTYIGHRTSNGLTTLGTVTDHHHLVQAVSFFFQDNRDVRLAAYLDFL